ncbi:hypothetical protein BDY21DRAFT_345580 [Lineolata rhizophorae]|uniref:Uncharacterized protein n=1 Tax=Lineolata rhizophorae TaxID=578093 RepID=A0A6A6P0I9_9PEZI|nr:hypothetical protein BDY21DRAFT_345580 [Lineolata rhizophorae]
MAVFCCVLAGWGGERCEKSGAGDGPQSGESWHRAGTLLSRDPPTPTASERASAPFRGLERGERGGWRNACGLPLLLAAARRSTHGGMSQLEASKRIEASHALVSQAGGRSAPFFAFLVALLDTCACTYLVRQRVNVARNFPGRQPRQKRKQRQAETQVAGRKTKPSQNAQTQMRKPPPQRT